MDYKNRIIDGKPAIWLQSYGWCEAKAAKDFKPGEFMRWNFGSEEKVLEVLKQTAKTITYKTEWKATFLIHVFRERKLIADRWVAIGDGSGY